MAGPENETSGSKVLHLAAGAATLPDVSRIQRGSGRARRDGSVQRSIIVKAYLLGFTLLAIIVTAASAPAQAQNGTLTRSFVSSSGVDTNPCTITQPCATFAEAYTKIGANGIIAALDPGKYGPLTNTSAITTGVTINGNGWSAITAPAQGNGITINAGTANVTLTGLEIDGAGAAYNGIVFNTGTNLTVSNCVVKDIIQNGSGDGSTGNGIWIAPTSSTVNFSIINTTVTNNQWAGISYLPITSAATTATGTIDHVVATNNTNAGIEAALYRASGGSVTVAVSNSIASGNGTYGILANAGSVPHLRVLLDNDQINNNQTGVENTSGVVILSRSVIAFNTTYGISDNNGTYTHQDNRYDFNGNGDVVNGNALSNLTGQQD
jgi:hypothetical protein